MKLRAYRSMASMTQQQLAEQLGVSQLSIVKYESGENIPSRTQMQNIYRLTNGAVTPNDFYDLGESATDVIFSQQGKSKQPFLAIGLMSGTSMDGIEASIIATDGVGHIDEIGSYSLKYSTEFKLLLRSAAAAVVASGGDLQNADMFLYDELRRIVNESPNTTTQDVESVIRRLEIQFLKGDNSRISLRDVVTRSTELHISTTQSLLKKLGYKSKAIDVVGYHGQTVLHSPNTGITIQIGDAKMMSDQLGVTVVSDFRTEDIRHGGTGAPLAPVFHKALALKTHLMPSAILNLGGIASVTIINQDDDQLFAFDAGPGAMLIDQFVFQRVGKQMDPDGTFGMNGRVQMPVLEKLIKTAILQPDSLNYLDKAPPKSLDQSNVKLIPELEPLSLNDGCATLAAFTAYCVGAGVRSLMENRIQIPSLWILSGGCARNKAVVKELQRTLSPIIGTNLRVQNAEKVSWNSDSLEAQMFGYLAVRRLKRLPTSLPGTTGVSHPVSGGVLSFPNGDARNTSKKIRSLVEGNSRAIPV